MLSVIVCCPENTYGPNCKSCPGGTKSPCNGNGKCDVCAFSLFMNLNQMFSSLFDIIALQSNLKAVCSVKHVQYSLDVSAIFIFEPNCSDWISIQINESLVLERDIK